MLPPLVSALFIFFSMPAPLCAQSFCSDKSKLCAPEKPSLATDRYPDLLVFVSFSMPMETLKTLGTQVNRLGGSLVFRGLIESSFSKTALKFKELGLESLIDPTLFESHKIERVPTFILRKTRAETAGPKTSHDRLSGNVSLAHVLERFAAEGDSVKAASLLLSKFRKTP